MKIKLLLIIGSLSSLYGCSNAPTDQDAQLSSLELIEQRIAELDKKMQENQAGDRVIEAQDVADELQLSQMSFLRAGEKASIVTPEGINADCSKGLQSWALQRGEVSLDHLELSNPKEVSPGRCQIDVSLVNLNLSEPKEAGTVIYVGKIKGGAEEKLLAFKTGLAFIPNHVGPKEQDAMDDAEDEANQDPTLDPNDLEARIQQILAEVLAKYNLNQVEGESEDSTTAAITQEIGRFPIGSIDANQLLVTTSDGTRRYLTLLHQSFDPSKNLYEYDLNLPGDIAADATATCSVQTTGNMDRANSLGDVLEVTEVNIENCPLKFAFNSDENKIGISLAAKRVGEYVTTTKYSNRHFLDSISNRVKLPRGTAMFNLEVSVPHYLGGGQTEIKEKLYIFSLSLYLHNEVAAKYQSIWDEFLRRDENQSLYEQYFGN